MKKKIWFALAMFILLSMMTVFSVSALPEEEEITDRESGLGIEEELPLLSDEEDSDEESLESSVNEDNSWIAENEEPVDTAEPIGSEEPGMTEEPAESEPFAEAEV